MSVAVRQKAGKHDGEAAKEEEQSQEQEINRKYYVSGHPRKST